MFNIIIRTLNCILNYFLISTEDYCAFGDWHLAATACLESCISILKYFWRMLTSHESFSLCSRRGATDMNWHLRNVASLKNVQIPPDLCGSCVPKRSNRGWSNWTSARPSFCFSPCNPPPPSTQYSTATSPHKTSAANWIQSELVEVIKMKFFKPACNKEYLYL